MKKKNQVFYNAALYLRLSSQNINESLGESDSIVNQEALLRSALKSYPEIEVRSVFKDDGWSGVNFNRPGFQKMMQKIYDGEIDCVVVKDLSRLGRNHTETGKYITRVFPALGVRFIAVNDRVDTADITSDMDNIIIPFKDLLNDSYARDISMKIRSAVAVKRAAGEFGGAFHPYGYLIDPKDKNHYVVDEEAADVVRKIYRWSFDGMGNLEIVRRLNQLHILPPSEHKKKQSAGEGYVPGDVKWNIFQVGRILRNDVYTGTLRLGKTTTPNYKVKKTIFIPEEEQHVFPDAHEAIIPKAEFELMQDVLSRDFRVNNLGSKGFVYPMTGFVYCAGCGASMTIKTSHAKGKHYRYYVCADNKKDHNVCSPHSVRFEHLTEVVLKALNANLRVLVEAEKVVGENEVELLTHPEIERIQIRIGKILEKKYEVIEFIKGLERDWQDGILTEAEYQDLKAEYEKEVETLQADAARLEQEKSNQVDVQMGNMYWIRKYKDEGKLTELTRRAVITFIDRIEVKDAEHIKIKFRFGDEYKAALKKKKSEGGTVDGKEVKKNAQAV